MDNATLRGRPTSAFPMVPSFIPTPAGDLREDAPVLSRVVAAVDGYPLAENATRTALALARQTGADLHLVTAAEYDDIVQPLDERRRYLRAVARRLGVASERTHLKIDVELTEAVTGVAGPGDAAMVCMGTNGRSGLGTAVVGSAAETVVRAAQLPVVLSGPRCTSTEQDVFGHVVVTLDGSACAEAALPLAGKLSRLLSAPALVVFVVDSGAQHPGRQERMAEVYVQRAATALAGKPASPWTPWCCTPTTPRRRPCAWSPTSHGLR